MSKLLLILNSKIVLYFLISLAAGIASYLLSEDRTLKSFITEVILAVFVGLTIAAPLAGYFLLGEQLTIVVVSISAISARWIVLFIKSNYGGLLKRLISKK